MIPVILALLLNSALLTGNEFAVAAFIHPSLSRQDIVQISLRYSVLHIFMAE